MNCGQTVLICRPCHLPSSQLSLLACNYRQKQFQHQPRYQISNMSWDGIFNGQGHINGVSTTSVNQSDSPWDTPFWKWSIKTGMQNYVPVSNIMAFIRKKNRTRKKCHTVPGGEGGWGVNIVGKTRRRRRHVCAFFRLVVLIFCQWTRKYCFFAFCSENWNVRRMNRHPISFRGGQICF